MNIFIIENYDYSISYEEFEDIKKSIWRNLANNGKEEKAISYMLQYLEKNYDKLDSYEIGGIYWHIGQLYALIDQYDKAINFMSKKETSSAIDKNYLSGTISFLKKDVISLKKSYMAMNKDPHASELNKNILKKFISNIGRKYADVY